MTVRWELLTVCHHPAKSDDHRYCDSGDILFLICPMISQDHWMKESCGFADENLSR